MARLSQTFDPSTVPPDDDFDLLPAHECMMQVIESEITKKDNGGETLSATFELLEGEYQSRRFWEYITLKGSDKAVEFGRRKLGWLANACNGGRPIDDSEELHFKPFLGKIGVNRSKDPNYKDRNDLRGARPLDSQPAAPAAPANRGAASSVSQPSRAAPPASTAAAPATAGGRPWRARTTA